VVDSTETGSMALMRICGTTLLRFFALENVDYASKNNMIAQVARPFSGTGSQSSALIFDISACNCQ
jgi:hypothetical protein